MSANWTPGLAWTMPLTGRQLLEASAGTGKTFTIADLVLRLILGDAVSDSTAGGGGRAATTIDQILVVTFTKAAAAELRDRIRRRLQEAAVQLADAGAGASDDDARLWQWLRGQADGARARTRLAAALADIDRASIATIHGFCQAILREQALAVGVEPHIVVSGDDRPRLERIARDYWLRTMGTPTTDPARAAAVRSAFGGNIIKRLTSLAEVAIAQRCDRTLRVFPSSPPTGDNPILQSFLIEFLAELDDAWEAERRRARALTYGDLPRSLERALARDADLAAALRRRFPVALIDEFQDTDPVQWSLFDRIWAEGEGDGTDAAPTLLAMIGDPKQAIYRFRGGDVHTYLEAARRLGDRRCSLAVNYRSDPALVEGLQAWLGKFDHPDGGAFGPGIGWSAVESPATGVPRLQPEGSPAVVLDWTSEPSFRVGEVPLHVVRWVRELVHDEPAAPTGIAPPSLPAIAGKDGHVRPIRHDDVAVLVPSASKGRLIHATLIAAGIPAALQTRSSVFALPIARHWLELLRGVLALEDGPTLAAALATPLVGLSSSALRDAKAGDDSWRPWTGAFSKVRDAWRSDGPGRAFAGLLDARMPAGGLTIRQRVLTWPDGLRAGTDLQHLVDLLVERAHDGHLGPAALLRWLEQRIAGVADEDVAEEAAQLRLERDAGAVRILTVHASKGLEFPVVLLPYVAADIRKGNAFPWLHPLGDQPGAGVWLDGTPPKDVKKKDPRWAEASVVKDRLEAEDAQEEQRLLYVALTRAAVQVRMLWFPAVSVASRAISRRLTAAAATDPRKPPELFGSKSLQSKTEGEERLACNRKVFSAVRKRLEHAGWEMREVSPTSGATVRSVGATARTPDLARPPILAPPSAVAGESWRIHSFTSLKHGVVRAERDEYAEGGRHDETETATPASRSDGWPDHFGGTRAGQLVHDLLEAAFREPPLLAAMASDECRRGEGPGVRRLALLLAEHGFAASADHVVGPLSTALHAALTTPIDLGDGAPLVLGRSGGARLAELGFLAPLRGEGGLIGQLDRASMAAHLRSAVGADPESSKLAGWAASALDHGSEQVHGLLTGFIDLAVEHEGRLWLIDWKTNRLPAGPAAADRVMAEQGYGLQALLYALAGRRFCRLRGDRIVFGGVLYVFLRAFPAAAGDMGATGGVIRMRPSSDWLSRIEKTWLDSADGAP